MGETKTLKSREENVSRGKTELRSKPCTGPGNQRRRLTFLFQITHPALPRDAAATLELNMEGEDKKDQRKKIREGEEEREREREDRRN